MMSYEVVSVSWNDLENLKPLDTIIFKDPLSVDLITEFAEDNKDWLRCTCAKIGLYDYCVYFKEVKTKERPWHKPQPLSPEFLEEQLFKIRDSDVVTASQLREKVRDCFAATMPEKLSPIYEHKII